MPYDVLAFGGSSDERRVSVASAQNLARAHDFQEIWFFDREMRVFKIQKSELLAHKDVFKSDFVSQEKKSFAFAKDFVVNLGSHLKSVRFFLGFHGGEGEDGRLQNIFEQHKIVFTGSTSSASENCFDKNKAKQLVKTQPELRLADSVIIHEPGHAKSLTALETFLHQHSRAVLKPLANGSSVGLKFVTLNDDLKSLLVSLEKLNLGAYLLEEFVEGRELTVGVYENLKGELKALPASEVLLDRGAAFDFDGKYLGKGSREITPAELTVAELLSVQNVGLRAHRALGCFGYTRTDVILNAKGVYFLETNTLPGLTSASFVPQQLEVAGLSLGEFVGQQLQLAERRHS
jgi:D-alanine-D-alanine ligase